MNKPITIQVKEFEQQIAKDINESGLPAFIILGVLKELLPQLQNIAEQQYGKDLKEWEAFKEEPATVED